MSVKVSVCIPVFRVEKYIEKCARSLFEQSMLDGLELVFVNDCSPDKSIEVLKKVLSEYPHRKPQTKIIDLPENGGVGRARRIAIENCAGEYIIHCDPDDWVDNDMYENMYEAAKKSDADIVYCNYSDEFDTGESKEVLIRKYDDCKTFLQGVLAGTIHCSLCNKLFKREFAASKELYAPDRICLSEDYLRVGQMLLECKKIVQSPRAYYHYRRMRKASYTNPQAYKKEYFYGTCEIIDFFDQILPPEYKEHTANFKAITLFKAVKHRLLTAKEFAHKWRSDRKKILFCPNLHPVKRVLLLSSFISYNVTSGMLLMVSNIISKRKMP